MLRHPSGAAEQQPLSPTGHTVLEQQAPAQRAQVMFPLHGGGGASTSGAPGVASRMAGSSSSLANGGGASGVSSAGSGVAGVGGASALTSSLSASKLSSLTTLGAAIQPNRSVNLLSPSGLNPDQIQRVQAVLASSTAVQVPPRIRAMELLHYWSSLESTAKLIEEHILEVTTAAGLTTKAGSSSNNGVDGGGSGPYSPKVPAGKQAASRSPHTTALKVPSSAGGGDLAGGSLTNSGGLTTDVARATAAAAPQVAAGGADDDDNGAPAEQPPAAQLSVEVPREDLGSMTMDLRVDDMPLVSSNRSLHLSLGSSTASVDPDASPRRRQRNLTSHPKSPRSTSPANSFHSAGSREGGHLGASSSGNLTAHYHIVDEVDAAHARGALSPRSVSPSMQLNQDLGSVPQSPMEFGPPGENSVSRRSPGGSSDSVSTTTPRRPGEEPTAPGRPSRSPSPAGAKIGDGTASAAAVLPPTTATASGANAKKAPAVPPEKPRYASYQDIPRFYFSEGKPQTQSTTLVGPHSTRHENPHLTIFEGVAVPVGAQAQLMLAQQQMQHDGVGAGGLQPSGPKMSPMLPLAIMEDEDVYPFIQREFARLPAPPPKPQPVAAPVASTGRGGKAGGSVLRRPTTSNAPTKQEQAYRQALTSTMQRVCTQAFGLPKYIGQLVFRKLCADSDCADDSPVPAAPFRPGTSSGNISGSNAGCSTITVAQVKEFYEKHLRFKSIVRRMFEVLIATSKVPGPVLPGSLGGAMGGVAPSALGSAAAGAALGIGGLGGSGGAGVSDPKRNYLLRDDFTGYLETLLESHPGLGFLRQTQDFQGKYMETVIIRIFYDLDRFDRGRISWQEFENSKLPDAIRQVDATEDINTVLNYFSYEHFYVLYCRFWELDEDKDLLISQQDLQKYAPDGAMNPKIVERVFQGHGRKLTCKTRGKMNYEDFVWFCLSEEDKTTPKSIKYWFRILDLDGDGVLSGYEIEAFYAHTKKQLLQMTTEGISFSDVVCQVADMLPFSLKQGLTLGDLLAAPQAAHVALNMIMNVVRFLQFEQRDPFVAHHDRLVGGFERTDWDRFARSEYDRMAQEADGDQ